MILVNGERLDQTTFPDGTLSFKYDPTDVRGFQIDWLYDGDQECMALWYLVHHIRAHRGDNAIIFLRMPYIPNARMDRVKGNEDVFTMKWFAEFINSLHFNQVSVFDPHSDVSVALLDRVTILPAGDCVAGVLHHLNDENGLDVLLCYPDEGAAKRYSAQLQGKQEYVFCAKRRNWQTGTIQGLELNVPEKVAGRNVLIVDDICSRGGTFSRAARALKDAGAKEVFLYVSHCENTIFCGKVLTEGLISHVFTTDSIYSGSHGKITVIQTFGRMGESL